MSMSELPPRPGAPEPPPIAVHTDVPEPPVPAAIPPPPQAWSATGGPISFSWSNAGKPPSSPPYVVAAYSRRVAAWVLDGVFLALWTVPAWLVLILGPSERYTCSDPETSGTVVDCGSGPSSGSVVLWLGLLLLAAIASIAYRVLLEGGERGQTLGKKLVGIRVVHESGEPLGYERALGRVLLQMVAWGFCFAVVLDYLWPIWDPRGQTLHDKIIDSAVIEA